MCVNKSLSRRNPNPPKSAQIRYTGQDSKINLLPPKYMCVDEKVDRQIQECVFSRTCTFEEAQAGCTTRLSHTLS